MFHARSMVHPLMIARFFGMSPLQDLSRGPYHPSALITLSMSQYVHCDPAGVTPSCSQMSSVFSNPHINALILDSAQTQGHTPLTSPATVCTPVSNVTTSKKRQASVSDRGSDGDIKDQEFQQRLGAAVGTSATNVDQPDDSL
ncbi:uncharacterized protein MELLADRAFT_90750 [Melampsora larici-populina 98AG31]|uniref:Uncharacterized protein n=1 Tax=Melampsora larici-populina (strain 98AG31 / pathotype 3-4-7) TaxID=747676 RepID=F4R7C6_MELLP|nr:uncharacterized protein MELLADRAFT_90750 [Melampsora larici-populina 98AG31]EGG11808.1 hypothetical protein MELLADRAFT_90750 [Melampsora larici-populina 98AG31]